MILLAYDGSESAKHAIRRAHEVLGHLPATVLHVWNPPVEFVTPDPFGGVSMPAGVPIGKLDGELAGAVQGSNTLGQHGWTGMKPPPGGGLHHYHFQLFALNRSLELSPTASLPVLVNELKSATIGKGEVVGTFETPEKF